ncbi:hypothetical protein BXZ70DRAFT_530879 [Cristinia sonorae]|uniref:Uncharacterized protein n=1 Tax=Cristinia sonorae TaxID=1940300 RepID=A0A8K0XTG0_9AGAR|nr:hypothetical protein BXZ70DRAFT_530879 [Cristinia sonorae]
MSLGWLFCGIQVIAECLDTTRLRKDQSQRSMSCTSIPYACRPLAQYTPVILGLTTRPAGARGVASSCPPGFRDRSSHWVLSAVAIFVYAH